jgi:predicted MFS family arabinose efflux permease
MTELKALVLKANSRITAYSLSIIKAYFSSYSGLPKLCWQGIILGFIEATLSGVCFFLSLYFVDDLHFSVAVAGVMISFYGLGRTIGGLLGGKLSDRISPGLVSIASLVIQAAAFLILIKLKTIYALMLNLFVLGVATYGFITSNNVWVLNHCKDQESIKLKTLSMLHAASNLGVGLSALLVSLLSRYGFSTIFLLSSVLLFVSAIYLVILEKSNQAASSQLHAENKIKSANTQTESRDVVEDKKVVWLVLGCLFSIGLIIAQLGTTYSIYLHDAFPTLGINGVSFLFALNSILIVIFQTPLVNFFSNYNKVFMVGMGAFLMGFGMFMLSFSFVFAMAILACVIYTIGEMLFFSMAQLVCYQKGGEKKKGHSLGMFRMIFAMSTFVGPTAGSFIYQHLGGNFVWLLCGVIGVTCLTACSYYRKYD